MDIISASVHVRIVFQYHGTFIITCIIDWILTLLTTCVLESASILCEATRVTVS